MSRRIIPQYRMYRVAALLLVVGVLWLAVPGAPSRAQDLNATIQAGYSAVFGYAQQVLSSQAGLVITSPSSIPVTVPSIPSNGTFTIVTGPNFAFSFGTPFGANPFVQPSMFSGWFGGYTIR
ncbi:MAG: hypothetical protein IT324_02520 [Anaerolineae bacterium]|nr:hypothetical protein [Anaerolineae bacterium]